jgi:dTMP kinase
MSAQGLFIVLEGIDGSGTTTQAKLLVEALQRNERRALYTAEPSGGPIGRLIRRALQSRWDPELDGAERRLEWSSLALLFAADRLDHAGSVIVPALEAGSVVVSDRYDLSSLIYQSLTAPDPAAALEWVRGLNAQARRPDLTVVLEVAPEAAEKRRELRGAPADLFEERALQERLAAAYRAAESFVPGDQLVRVSAIAEIEQVAAAVAQAVSRAADIEFRL